MTKDTNSTPAVYPEPGTCRPNTAGVRADDTGALSSNSLLSRLERWIEKNQGYVCCRRYQPGFAPAACDVAEMCAGCMIVAAAYELRQRSGHETNPRLAEAEALILRMSGEGVPRAQFYVDKYDLTGERRAQETGDGT